MNEPVTWGALLMFHAYVFVGVVVAIGVGCLMAHFWKIIKRKGRSCEATMPGSPAGKRQGSKP